MGGPRHADIDTHVRALLAAGADVSVAEAFAAGTDELRRPVDLLGYLELADATPTTAAAEVPVESVVARRPDGTQRTFVVPRVPLRPTPSDENLTPASPDPGGRA